MSEPIDTMTRRAVAMWARGVALEDEATPDHAVRRAIAKRMLESIAPATPAQEGVLVHVVFLVRAFLGRPEDEATQADVESLLDQVMAVFVRLGAFA
jgi:hypothetical protein